MSINYIIVSPVKDEERYVEETLKSVVGQTMRPSKWIIVDDGSTDRTPEIVGDYYSKHSWIKLLRLDRRGKRVIPAEIRAFNEGYKLVNDEPFDFIVKLDCDLSLESRYFERLLEEFKQDSRLGIASGVYLEQNRDKWVPVKMPDYHTSGASKMVRAECFRDIGGFVLERGWDTLDEIRAQMTGWHTRHFPSLEFRHLKNEGAGLGYLAANAMHGEIYYKTGGSVPFFTLKALDRFVTGRPFVLGGLMMVYGYLKARLLCVERVVTDEEANFYRRVLNQRIKQRLLAFLGTGRAVGKHVPQR